MGLKHSFLVNDLQHPAVQSMVVSMLGLVIGLNSQFAGILNPYLFNGDVAQHIFWMYRFADSELFANDLLTEYAAYIQPWGFAVVYRLLAYFADPLIVSKIVPIVLFTLSTVYLFLLVRNVAGGYAGLIAASAFMIFPDFMLVMSGGYSRAFGYPLVLAFLYYLSKRSYQASAVVLVLSALIYPPVFFVCALTYFSCLLFSRKHRFWPTQNTFAVWCFCVAVFLCGGIFLLKYVVPSDFGTLVSRNQMEGRPEYYMVGRYPVLPTPTLAEVSVISVFAPVVRIVENYPQKVRDLLPEFLNMRSFSLLIKALAVLLGIYLIWQITTKRLALPIEVIYLAISGVIFFKLADIFTFKLYLADRYILYTLPVASLILVCIRIAGWLNRLGNGMGIKVLKCLLVIAVLGHFNVIKGVGLTRDESKNEAFYRFLGTLPKDAVIAAHPNMADFIPTFSKRKVFINRKLSHPFWDRYWDVIKVRTFDFFDAYYADSPEKILAFCRKYNIDYFVVDRRDFKPELIERKETYFEPFNHYIKTLTHDRYNYAADHIPPQYWLFTNGQVFVVDATKLGDLDQSKLRPTSFSSAGERFGVDTRIARVGTEELNNLPVFGLGGKPRPTNVSVSNMHIDSGVDRG